MRVLERPGPGGRTRMLIVGAAHYPHAQDEKLRVPRLPDISSAAESAVRFATRCIVDWQDSFARPIGSIELLVNDATAPDGIAFTPPGGAPVQLEAPTLANIKAARRRWTEDAGPEDLLLFYCCGHGVWLPSASRTFLAADFGVDDEEPWSNAISLDDFKLAMGDQPPREQWLLFDCCANTPTVALEATRARPNPLLQPIVGARGVMERLHGPLSQVAVAAASTGAQAFGKPGRASRFMEVLLEAFDEAGFRTQGDDGRWWLDQQGLENAMSSYAFRVAPPEEEAYFTFARLTETDAAETPRLLGRAEPPRCTLLVSSDPSERLRQCDLAVTTGQPARFVAGQAPGPAALTRFRHDVDPFLVYDIAASFPEGVQTQSRTAVPPILRARFA